MTYTRRHSVLPSTPATNVQSTDSWVQGTRTANLLVPVRNVLTYNLRTMSRADPLTTTIGG